MATSTTKQLTIAPQKSIPVALLDFGKMLYDEDRRPQAERNPDRILEAEALLIEQVSSEKSSALKAALNITVSNRCDAYSCSHFVHAALHRCFCDTRLAR